QARARQGSRGRRVPRSRPSCSRGRSRVLLLEVLIEAKIPLPRVAEHGHDLPTGAEFPSDIEGDLDVRSGARSDQDSFAAPDRLLEREGISIEDGAHLVDHERVIVLRYEAGGDAL